MKKNIYIVIVLVGLLIVGGCDKLPMNGKLDGKWQLKTIIKDSQEKNQEDSGIFWSFQLKLCQITYMRGIFDGASNIANTRFLYKNDSLFIFNIYLNFRNRDSLIVTPTTIFEEAGITGSQEGFKVITLNKKNMLLENGNKKLLFRKLE